MNPMQFGYKALCLVLLTLVILLGSLGAAYAAIRLESKAAKLLIFPIFHILVLGAILGYAEQRYLTPAYPFLVVGTAIFLGSILDFLSRRKQVSEK
jgi:uncharacterized membrane protein YgdD (TMEM256/DUF423 family)